MWTRWLLSRPVRDAEEQGECNATHAEAMAGLLVAAVMERVTTPIQNQGLHAQAVTEKARSAAMFAEEEAQALAHPVAEEERGDGDAGK